jgi:phage terminase large subunit GpA-like protein
MRGETYEESGEEIGATDLQAKADTSIYSGDTRVVPEQVLFATWGADVQGDRLEVHLVGWGIGEEAWSIDYRICNGSPSNPHTWAQLDDFLNTEWTTGDGRVLDIPIGGIDTGDGNTQQHVMEWLRPRMKRRRGPQPFKGANQFEAPIWTIPRRPKKGEQGKILPWMIGVSQAKLVVYDRLRMEEPGPGYIHFPSHYDEHFFKGLTAEKLITRYNKGFPRKEWHLRSGQRNEPLDTTVYAYAAMKILNPDWDALAGVALEKIAENRPEPAKKPRKVARKGRKMRIRV